MVQSGRERFVGKTAFVTGGSSGIGLATVKALALEGAKVMIVARRADVGEAAAIEANKVAGAGGEVRFLAADVTDGEAVEKAVAATVSAFGGLDIAFNNAGMTGDTGTAIYDADEQKFREVMKLNVEGVWHALKHQFRAMMKRGGGAIVVCGSAASVRGGGGLASAYYASKHAVLGLAKQAAMDGAPHNIRVNAVLPGLVWTDLSKKSFEGQDERLAFYTSRIPMKRPGRPEEVANATLFLCSEESSYITGVGLSVDGGFTV